MKLTQYFTLFVVIGLASIGQVNAQEISTKSADGVTVFGETYFAKLASSSPLILLFHQAGSNGRGEYGELIPWLNKAGYRAIAWDLRSGNERFGATNRTQLAMPKSTPDSYCDAYADMQSALDFTIKQHMAEKVVVWGSSYSAALVVQLAAKNPQTVAAVTSFSPASGQPMAGCEPQSWLGQLKMPALFLRPKSEMGYDSVIAQQKLFQQAGFEYRVIEGGVHGASMLVDSRTKKDMGAARQGIIQWLSRKLK